MRILLFLLYIFVGSSLKGQSVSSLDADYGLKPFKFGLSPSELKNISKDKIQFHSNRDFSTYSAKNRESLFGARVDNIRFTFYKNKLYEVDVMFGSIFTELSEKDYNKIINKLRELYGPFQQKPINGKTILRTATWAGKNVTLEFIEMKLPDFDKKDHMISIYENALHTKTLKYNY